MNRPKEDDVVVEDSDRMVAGTLRALAAALADTLGAACQAVEQLRELADLVDPPAAVGVPADQEGQK